MKLTPVSSPAAIQTPQTTGNSDAKARAVAMLTGSQPTQSPVANQNSISPEEMGAIKTNSQKAQDTDENGQVASNNEPEVTEQVKEPTAEEKAAKLRFDRLAQQEKAVRQKEQMLRQKEAEIKAKEEAFNKAPKAPEVDMSKFFSKDQLKQDALQVLADAGISYDDLTQQILNAPTRDPRVEAQFNELKNEIKRLQEANEQSKKSAEEQSTQSYQAAVKQIHTDVKKLVFTDPQFEAIKTGGHTQDVVDLIEATFREEGYVMDIEEAAKQVEDFLIEEYTKLTKIEKIQKRLAEAKASNQQATSVKTSEQPKTAQPQMKTLTNNTSTSRQLSARERAILAFKNELK